MGRPVLSMDVTIDIVGVKMPSGRLGGEACAAVVRGTPMNATSNKSVAM